jgi:hypothetical protein
MIKFALIISTTLLLTGCGVHVGGPGGVDVRVEPPAPVFYDPPYGYYHRWGGGWGHRW